MRNRKLLLGVVASSTMVLSMAVAVASSPRAAAPKTVPAAKSAAIAGSDFVVVYKNAGAVAAALADITRAGGTVVSQNTKLGYAVVKSTTRSSPRRLMPRQPCLGRPATGSSEACGHRSARRFRMWND